MGLGTRSEWPFVTIAIPCLNEARCITAAVNAALEQLYPPSRVEVLVADGGSTDGTWEILERIDHPRVRILRNPGKIQARAMNEMIRHARGDILVRFDAHADYAPSYVRACVRALEGTGADVVGGAQRALGRNAFQRAVCAALASPLGVGGAAYRSAGKQGWVDTVWLGAYRRRIFETVGLYDPGAITNEDAELNQRVVMGGGRIYLSAEVIAHYYPRDSWRSLARQYFRYGSGRARTMLKHRGLPKLRPMIPFGTLVAGTGMLATRSRWLVPCLAAYAVLTGAEAARVGAGLGVRGWLRVWSIFPVLHVAHGTGFAAGLWRYWRRPDWQATERLAPRKEHDDAVA
jgi:glycosyltransferase involved in cell wall biosynthesis